MGFFFDRHIDGQLQTLGEGRISAWQYRSVVHHAKTCHRCAALYDKAIRLLRHMEHQSFEIPAAVEERAILQLGRGTLHAQKPAPKAWLLGVVALSACVLIVFASEDRWQPRGAPLAKNATLRLFCGGGTSPLHEAGEDGCKVGEALAFAAGAKVAGSKIELSVSGVAQATATLEVKGVPGSEQALELTVPLREVGVVNVHASIGETVIDLQTAVRR